MEIDKIVLHNLLHDEVYCRQVLPFLKLDYFEGGSKTLYKGILDFITKYNRIPSVSSLEIDLPKIAISNEQLQESLVILRKIESKPDVDYQWILDTTEKWCKDRSVYLAIMESINIIDGKSKKYNENAIPDILQKALSVTFDTRVGHDYLEDYQSRYESYHEHEEKIAFDLEKFNEITGDGVPNKTLTVAMGGTGAGKSLFLTHVAASHLSQGKNVLYITLEMSEQKIAERIDANLFDVDISDIKNLTKDTFEDKLRRIQSKTNGKLIIKEYPTASAHVNHFRALLNELKMKKKFEPDSIFIDYLNICASARMKGLGGSVNTYSFVKAIAEEVRGLAVEFDVPIFTATQVNRSGYNSSDVELTDTSESFGLPATADLFFALITTEELEKVNQLMIKQLKNRYNDVSKNRRFVVGIDRSKMKLYDVEDSAQTLITPNNNERNNENEIDYSDFKF
jgi:archaellum biogenesis ATPase FlaH